MHFYVLRDASTAKSTPGRLYLQQDGGDVFIGYTLEDVVRSGPKVHGRTAIPAGTYGLSVTFSNHFQKPLPLLANVPNFSGVRIPFSYTNLTLPTNREGYIVVVAGYVKNEYPTTW